MAPTKEYFTVAPTTAANEDSMNATEETQPILSRNTDVDAARVSHHDDESDSDFDNEEMDEIFADSSAITSHTAQASSSSSSATRTAATAAVSSSQKHPIVNDGVFSNLSAKLSSEDNIASNQNSNDDTPPAYDSVGADRAPEYPHVVIVTTPSTTGNPDDTLVNGRAVGSGLIFLATMLVSMVFQSVGFLIAFLFSQTHAGREGAKTGIGLVLLHTGINLRQRVMEASSAASQVYIDQDGNLEDEQMQQQPVLPVWVAYVFMVLGWFTVIESASAFLRARRLRAVINAQPQV